MGFHTCIAEAVRRATGAAAGAATKRVCMVAAIVKERKLKGEEAKSAEVAQHPDAKQTVLCAQKNRSLFSIKNNVL
jgi:hypothetical protein